MKYLKYAPLVSLVLCLLLVPIVAASREETIDTTYDGFVRDAAPTTRDDGGAFIETKNPPVEHRFFIEWDISTIPDTAIIDDVDIYYRAHAGAGGGATVRHMDLRPSLEPDNAAGNDRVLADAGNGTAYATTQPNPMTPWAWYTTDLGDTANTDLQTNLAVDWFAIGGVAGADQVRLSSMDNASAAQLIVTYHLPTDSEYVVSNPIYENNTDAGSVTIYWSTDTNSTSQSVGTTTTIYTNEPANVFYWAIGGSYTRKIYTPNEENFTITIPESTFYAYEFTVKDFTGKLGEGQAYVEAWRTINGVDVLIERNVIIVPNAVALNLVYGATYKIYVLFSDATRFSWGDFTALSDVTNVLILRTTEFSDQLQPLYGTIFVEATRSTDGATITVDYNDTRENTVWANVSIRVRNGAVVNTATRNNDTYTYNWGGADDELGYIVTVSGDHTDFGEWGYVKIFDESESFPDAPDLTGIFDFGLGVNFGAWLLTTATVIGFSKAWQSRSILAGMVMATLLRYIGWADWDYNFIIFGWLFTIVVVLAIGGNE